MTFIPPAIGRQELHQRGEEFAALVWRQLTRVANSTAARVADSQPLVASPYISIDTLVVVGAEWEAVVAGQLIPVVEQMYRGSSVAWTLALQRNLAGWATAVIPPVRDAMAEQYLAGASNRLRGIGDELWSNARSSLLEGFEAGEDIPALADRVRAAAAVTEPRATTIARTEIVSASNRGSYDTAKMLADLDESIVKVWMSTPDERTRPTHVAADEQRQPFDEPFTVGGASLEHPGDPTGPPEEVINCRCVIGWEFPDDSTPPAQLAAPDDQAAGEESTMESEPLTAAAVEHDGAMIALVPTAADAARLAIDGGEPADELHVTLMYLGEASGFTAVPRRELVQRVRQQVAGMAPVTANAFGVSAYNPASDQWDTALVLTLGGQGLDAAHEAALAAVDGFAGELPAQHSPWHAHLTLTYTDDLSLMSGPLLERLGEVSFDRVRVAFGNQVEDIPLTGGTKEDGDMVATGHDAPDAAVAQTDPCPPGQHRMPDGTCMPDDEMSGQAAEDGCPPGQRMLPDGTCVPAAQAEPAPQPVAQAEPPAAAGPTAADHDYDCPPGTRRMPDGSCAPVPMADQEYPEHFHAVMIIEGVSTGLRTFAPGSLTWREPPFSLRWQQQEPEGGGHALAVGVGNVERAERQGVEIHGWGRLDLDDPTALEFARKLVEGFVPWVSIGLDEQPVEVELIWPDGQDPSQTDDLMEALFAEPEQLLFHSGRIGELTAVTVPAQAEARIEALPALVQELARRGVLVASASEFGAVGVHDTAVSDRSWDGPANEVRLDSPMSVETARAAYAWIDSERVEDGEVVKDACRFIHHHISEQGVPGAANLQACRTGIGVLNGARGGTTIPAGDRQGVYNHLAGHIRDADEEPPPLLSTTEQGVEVVTAAAHTITIPDVPPEWWFDEPADVAPLGALTITDEGRVYGYLAPAGLAHRAYRDRRVEVPRGRVDYSRWMGGEAIVAGGARVVCGPITMECGHISPHATSDASARMQHYDNACAVVAKARIGENRHGVWVAGALEPGVTPDQLSRMLACRLSGDWAPHPERRGWQEFVAALLVPVPGFAQPRTGPSVRVREGALVASAVPVRLQQHRPAPEPDTRAVLERLARSIGRDATSRMRALHRKVHNNHEKDVPVMQEVG